MGSFNQRIRPFEGKENMYQGGDFCQQCHPYSTNGKKVLASYEARYDYVTGKRGRVSWKSFYLCKEHGEKFINKYKIEKFFEVKVRDEGAGLIGERSEQ